jgi:hypothetical protein
MNARGYEPVSIGIFTIVDVNTPGSVYPLERSGRLALPAQANKICSFGTGVWSMIRQLLVVTAVIVATISAASISESAAGSATSPVLTTSCLPEDYAHPSSVHCNPPTPLPGDTYQCRDGCFSDSKTSQGACSHHGGIDHAVNQGNG